MILSPQVWVFTVLHGEAAYCYHMLKVRVQAFQMTLKILKPDTQWVELEPINWSNPCYRDDDYEINLSENFMFRSY
jgi:hypothetical protein